MGEVSITALGKSKTSQRVIKFICLFLSEYFGTLMLIFFTCITNTIINSKWAVCLNYGLAALTCTQIWGVVSGAHMNPAVTIGALAFGSIHWAFVPVYLIAQIGGAITGYCLVQLASHGAVGSIIQNGMTIVIIKEWKGVLIEFCLTGAIVLVYCSSWDQRQEDYTDSIPLRIGLAIAACCMAGDTFTGGSMNPARSFAPALYHGIWKTHWVYWAGPLLGAVCAALFYRLLFEREKSAEKDTDVEVNVPGIHA